MQIILKEDIIGLGYKNDIVDVKPGYGRNFLIPTGKAVIATASAKKVLAENLRQQAQKLERLKAAAQERAKAFEGVALEIATKVSTTGVAYGSVGVAHVVEALKAIGIEVDRKIITMKDAKTIGDFVALVHFHKEVVAEVPVKVVAENASAEEKKEAEAAPAPVAEAAPAPVAEAAPVVDEAPAQEAEAATEE